MTVWSLVRADPTGQDFIFIALLAFGIFLFYVAMFSTQRLMGLIGCSLGFVTWFALAGVWLNLGTDFPGLAWLFYGVGMVHVLLLLYGVWGYYLDKKGVLSRGSD